MATYKVWHTDARNRVNRDVVRLPFGGVSKEEAEAIFAGVDPCIAYVHAADVQVVNTIEEMDALDICFEKTNTIDRPWTQNHEVVCHTDRPRSTSTGDVIEAPNGNRWLVAAFGFTGLKPKE